MKQRSEQMMAIIGGGPAGLSAAHALQREGLCRPLIFEQSDSLGGISRTINYNGNRIDIGGHRFFSKSDVVMNWWQSILSLQGAPASDDVALHRTPQLTPNGPDPEATDKVMLVRTRLSRIYFLKKFFDYPLKLSAQTLLSLGTLRTIKIGFSYFRARLAPIREEKSLEDFMINRFGRELYATFFRDYTEKVWGKSCRNIKPEWGKQRIRGVSVSAVIIHALGQLFPGNREKPSQTETSLIETFHYPKHGPGQLWESVGEEILVNGGEIMLRHKVVRMSLDGDRISSIVAKGPMGEMEIPVSAVFSSMPVIDLLHALGDAVPQDVRKVGEALCYRDFITVGLLLDRLDLQNQTDIKTINNIIPDNWIYIQEKDIKVGRVQLFNNWSPYMVNDSGKVWLGMEYFCQEDDELWSMPDDATIRLALDELVKIGFINDARRFVDGIVIREPKAYPGYFGEGYDNFNIIKEYLLGITNLYPIGRNGMHRYNNMDHSVLTAFRSVDCCLNKKSKNVVWDINVEEEYHEVKKIEQSYSPR